MERSDSFFVLSVDITSMIDEDSADFVLVSHSRIDQRKPASLGFVGDVCPVIDEDLQDLEVVQVDGDG